MLKYFRNNTRKKVVVFAPTGIAALNVRGQTIHSFFYFKLGVLKKEEVKIRKDVEELLDNIDTIIVDEASMVRADVMDAIDYALRKA